MSDHPYVASPEELEADRELDRENPDEVKCHACDMVLDPTEELIDDDGVDLCPHCGEVL